MTIKSKQEYFQAIKLRYHVANKQAKAPFLMNFMQIVVITANMPSGCLTVKNEERKKYLPDPSLNTMTKNFWQY